MINIFVGIPKTFSGVADRSVKSLLRNYTRIDIVTDGYVDHSLKALERKSRGESDQIQIASLASKVPSDFQGILQNGDNQNMLIELIIEHITKNKVKICNIPRCRRMVISTYEECISLTITMISDEPPLVILHCHRIATNSPTAFVTVRSHSGDTDIVVLAFALLQEFRDRIA